MRVKHVSVGEAVKPISNIVIILGANNAGKTTLLKDIYFQATRSSNRSNSTTDTTKWPGILPNNFFEVTKEEFRRYQTSLRRVEGQSPVTYASSNDINRDSSYFIDEGHYNSLTQDVNNLSIEEIEANYSVYLKGVAFLPLWVESRFTVSGQSSAQNTEPDNPSFNIPSFLVSHEEVFDAFNRYLLSFFHKVAYFQPHLLPNIEITVGDQGASEIEAYEPFKAKKSAEVYQGWKAKNNLHTLNSAFGHGIQAAAEILFRLTLNSDVYFIDEPELHLYPETKRRLGNLITSLATKKQFFIVTHDVDFLDGLLASADAFDVIRINSKRDLEFYTFSGNSLEKIQSSKRNSDAVRVAFHDYAIYVEGVKDKYLYESAMNTDKLLENESSIVVPCHGNDRIHEFLPISQELNIKAAVITDFDTLACKKRGHDGPLLITQIVEKITKDASKINEIKKKHLAVYPKIKGIDDISIKGINAIDDDAVREEIKILIGLLKQVGVYVISEGALESWFDVGKDVEVETLARRYKYASKKTYKKLRDFLSDVTSYVLQT